MRNGVGIKQNLNSIYLEGKLEMNVFKKQLS